jgi:hypothetical protein
VKYLINGTLRPEKSRADFRATISDNRLSDEAWELVRKGMVTAHGFKIGQRAGFILIMEGDSEEAVQAAISRIPILRDGWFDIEVDPMSPFLSDIR